MIERMVAGDLGEANCRNSAGTVGVIEQRTRLGVVDDVVIGIMGCRAGVKLAGAKLPASRKPGEHRVLEENLVVVGVEVLDGVDIVGQRRVEDETVLSLPAIEQVIAKPAGQPVGALAALQRIDAVIAGEAVIAAAAGKVVVAAEAGDPGRCRACR